MRRHCSRYIKSEGDLLAGRVLGSMCSMSIFWLVWFYSLHFWGACPTVFTFIRIPSDRISPEFRLVTGRVRLDET